MVQEYYYELTIKPKLYYELFLDLVSSLTDEALEELDETIIIRSEESLENIIIGVEAFAKELSIAFDTNIECETILQKKQNQDWIKNYQQSVKPIEVGTFYVHPSWEEEKKDKLNIVIDPSLAFGSGHHETTNKCLSAIEKYVKKDMSVCDVGTGSGILAIAAAKLEAKVDICDTDSVCIKDSIKNFKLNSVCFENSWEGSASGTSKQYDIVIANIVADVITLIAKDLKKITKDDGVMILSGIMQQHKQKVLKKFEQCAIIEQFQQNEWVTLVMKKEK